MYTSFRQSNWQGNFNSVKWKIYFIIHNLFWCAHRSSAVSCVAAPRDCWWLVPYWQNFGGAWLSIMQRIFHQFSIVGDCTIRNNNSGGLLNSLSKHAHCYILPSNPRDMSVFSSSTLIYCQFSNISHIQSQNINVSRVALQLSLPNPLKPYVKLRTKM